MLKFIKAMTLVECAIVVAIIAVILALVFAPNKGENTYDDEVDEARTYNDYVVWRMVIPKSKQAEAAAWITDTVRSLRVEDADDAIEQAEKTARELFGEMTIGVYLDKDTAYPYRRFLPYDRCTWRQKALCDEYLNASPPERDN